MRWRVVVIGERVTAVSRGSSVGEGSSAAEGVRGLKSLGVRDLTYRLCFMACAVEPDRQVLPSFPFMVAVTVAGANR